MSVSAGRRPCRAAIALAALAGCLCAVRLAGAAVSASRSVGDNGIFSLTLGTPTANETIPLVRNVTGAADVFGTVTTPVIGFPPLATASIPSAVVKGNIATLGPPPAFATVQRTPAPISLNYPGVGGGLACNAAGTSVVFAEDAGDGDVKVTALCSASAATSAPNPPGFGPALLGTTATVFSKAATDPYVVAALDEDMPAVVTVNLIENYLTDPSNAKLRFEAVSPPEALAVATTDVHLYAVTNLPGHESLFDLRITATSDDSLSVTFTNSLGIPAPITAADFTHPSTGIFELSPAKRSFDLPFTIPEGEFGSDGIGTYGMTLDVFFERSADVHGVPEPATGMLFGFAVAAHALRRRPARRTRTPH